MKIYDVVLNDDQKGVYAISVVEDPAMEGMFIALNKDREIKLAEVDQEKRILMGVALIPDKEVYRNQGGEEFFIRFSKQTIEKAAHLFLSNGYQNESSLEHQLQLQGMSVVESWIIEGEQDKSRKYGFNYPEGSWMVSMKVNDDRVWNEFVKTGKVKGFSIDGLFSLEELKLKSDYTMSKNLIDELKDFFKKESISLTKEEPKEVELSEETPAETEEVKAETPATEAVEEPQVEAEAETQAEETEEVKEDVTAELKAELKKEIETFKAEFTKQLEAKDEEIKTLKAELASTEGAKPTKHAPKQVDEPMATTSRGRIYQSLKQLS